MFLENVTREIKLTTFILIGMLILTSSSFLINNSGNFNHGYYSENTVNSYNNAEMAPLSNSSELNDSLQINSTLLLWNNTLVDGSTNSSSGYYSITATTYDPATGNIYIGVVLNSTSEGTLQFAIYIVNSTTDHLTKKVFLNDVEPFRIFIDPFSNLLYVYNGLLGSNQIVIYYPSNMTQKGVFSTGVDPQVSFNPTNGDAYLYDNSDTAKIINVSGNVTGSINLPYLETGHIFYNPENNYFYTWNSGYINNTHAVTHISVMNVANGTFFANIFLNNSIIGSMTLDPVSGNVYATNTSGNNILILNSSQDKFTSKISLSGNSHNLSRYSVSFDPLNNEMIIASSVELTITDSNFYSLINVTSINASTNVIMNFLQVANASKIDNHFVSSIYDPWNGMVLVPDEFGSVFFLHISSTKCVDFKASDLKNNSSWELHIGYYQYIGHGGSLHFSLSPGYYSYKGTVISPDYGNVKGNFTVGLINLSVETHFPEKYSLTFREHGLLSNMCWEVSVNSNNTVKTNNSSVTFYEANGSYQYSVRSINQNYSITGNSTGTVEINGSARVLLVNFSLVTYTITFEETGISADSVWYSNISGGLSSGPILTTDHMFLLPNGTYEYSIGNPSGYYTNKTTGTFTVSGEGISIHLLFLRFNYISGNLFPHNSTLFINGEKVSINSYQRFNISEKNGRYEIKAILPGYASFYKNVTLGNGTVLHLNITLNAISNNQTGLYRYNRLIEYGAIITVSAIIAGVGASLVSRKRHP